MALPWNVTAVSEVTNLSESGSATLRLWYDRSRPTGVLPPAQSTSDHVHGSVLATQLDSATGPPSSALTASRP